MSLNDVHSLKQLHDAALQAQNFKAFAHTLDMNGNEQ